MSNLLKEKCSLAKLKEELEERRGKLCFSCKGFGHLTYCHAIQMFKAK